jgi:hypothetical protein
MRTRVVRSCLSRFAGILLCCLAATGLLATGCKSGSLGPAKQYAQVDYAHGGTVSGIVHFTKTAPSPIQIDMAQDPICAMAGDDMTESFTRAALRMCWSRSRVASATRRTPSRESPL